MGPKVGLMAAKRKSKRKFEFKGFVNLEFSNDERDEITRWMEEFGEGPVDASVILVEAMWKVSLSWDSYHGAYQLAITCHEEGSTYYGRCFAMKHVDLARGLLILRWFYDEKLKNEVYALDEPGKGFDW